jgi:TM2 domain-containing membrane protein YozV
MFCRNCGKEITDNSAFCSNCGTRLAAESMEGVSPKSRLAATLFAVFLGQFGAHRFYTGKISTAIVMLVMDIVGWATIWIFGLGLILLIPVWIWALVDFIYAVSGYAKDAEDKIIKNW